METEEKLRKAQQEVEACHVALSVKDKMINGYVEIVKDLNETVFVGCSYREVPQGVEIYFPGVRAAANSPRAAAARRIIDQFDISDRWLQK